MDRYFRAFHNVQNPLVYQHRLLFACSHTIMSFAVFIRAFSAFIAFSTTYICMRYYPWKCCIVAGFLLGAVLSYRHINLVSTPVDGESGTLTTKQSDSSPAVSHGPIDPMVFDDTETCKSILACTYGSSSRDIPLHLKLEARALPNQRLQTAFGIDNAFTTADVSWYKEFRELSESRLKLSTDQWASIATIARSIAAGGIPLTSPCSIALTPLVQQLTLKISLSLLFGLPASSLSDSDVCTAASEINRIWLASKQPGGGSIRWHEQHRLIAAMQALVPAAATDCDPLTPRRNPLNLILPAYETTWRVVLRCVLEVCFRTNAGDGGRRVRAASGWRAALKAFSRRPTPHVFASVRRDAAEGGGAPVSAAFVAKEALRLYPPTRRVYRDLLVQHPGGGGGGVLRRVAADIEALHRADPGRGGGDSGTAGAGAESSSRFWPARWISGGGDGEAQVGPFLAFGGARFVCPASAAFGPMMVGVLAGTLVEALEQPTVCDSKRGRAGDWVVEDAYADEMMRVAQPLSSEREAYGDLRIMRQ